jgi:uncharacterized protein YjiS (DUF1127 family)
MSIIAIPHASPSITERVQTLLQRLFARESAQGRLYKDLRNLPDHLLLDIGIDPRDVPNRTDGVIARPDLAHGGVVTMAFRTVAKSR